MSNYRKTMADALREMYPINEDTVELDEAKYELYHKDFSSAMQHAYHVAKKHHGITIDPEEIDNKVATGPRKPSEGKTNTYRLKGDKGAVQIQVYNKGGSKPFELNMYKEEVELDEANLAKMSDDVLKSRLSQMEKSLKTRGDSPAIQFEIKRLKKEMKKRGIQEEVGFDKLPDMSDALRQVRMNEEVDLDEALAPNVVRGDDYVGVPDRVVALAKQKVKKMNTSTASDHSKAMQKALSDMGWEMTVSGKYVKEEAGLDEAPRRPKAPKMKTTDIMRDRGKKAGPKTYQVDIDGSRATVTAASEKMAIQKAMTQLKINKKIKPLPKATVKVVEETDLDEATMSSSQIARLKKSYEPMRDKKISVSNADKLSAMMDKVGKDKEALIQLFKADIPFVSQSAVTKLITKHNMKGAEINKLREEVELDEGKMSQLHQYIKDKKSAEEIAKLMKVDVKTIKALMSSHHPEEVEEGAAADARRAMSRDKDFSRRDSADDDTDATDDDVKGASKNIMMQMRKAQSLRGRFDVEFADGKKTKVSAGVAMAVQSKYNSLKKPADKEKFQARIGKSYKDMLKALKEELQPKKESILERMNRKIKEKNDG